VIKDASLAPVNVFTIWRRS